VAVTVTAFDGRPWRVGRRWLPWRWGLRRPVRDLDNLPDPDAAGCLGDAIGEALEAFFVAILAIVAIVLFVVFVVPVLIALIEVVLLLLLVLAGVAARVVLRRPWIVDARVRGDVGVPLSWKVVGWRRSGEVIQEVATQLAAGPNVIAPRDAEPC
jgi:hypothetical protein